MTAMTHVGYVVGGYAVTAVALIAYVARLGWRARALTRATGLETQRQDEAAVRPAPRQSGVAAAPGRRP